AGIMNKTKEEVGWEVQHFIILRKHYSELVKMAESYPFIWDKLEDIRQAFDAILSNWELGEERKVENLFDEADINRLIVLTALIEEGYIESDENLRLIRKPKLEELVLELRFPVEEIEDLEEFENASLVAEFTLMKHYYVEVMEVEKELIQKAVDIAEDYATEESLVDALFVGIAKSVLADVILKLAEEKRKKSELIEALFSREPIVIEGRRERINLYFDEEAIEDFLKELQALGYLKVKGNRIWI
ncbi:MAG: hypothetical protein J7M26_10580, partial [Armatimonadetes bacterium]|nr:hypothetical protein [Armatimonadota bacterium]